MIMLSMDSLDKSIVLMCIFIFFSSVVCHEQKEESGIANRL